MDPFGIFFRAQQPQTTGRSHLPSLNFLTAVRDRNKLIDHLLAGVREKNHWANESLTMLHSLSLTVFVAAATFLGVSLGIISATKASIPSEFVFSAWALLFCFVIGTISTGLLIGYERNRATELRMFEEIGVLLLMEGSQDQQAIEFIGKTIDRKKTTYETFYIGTLLVLRNVAMFGDFIAVIVMTASLLMRIS